jgi:Kdo2-lipid IVA lauroyltransferase/acyltransferase
MRSKFIRMRIALSRGSKFVVNAAVGWIAVAALKLLRHTSRQRTADAAGWTMRKFGPWLPEHRVGRSNLTAAFPDKSSAEIERILAGVWDNLARVGAEFAHIDRMRVSDPERPGPSDITYEPETKERFHRLRLDNKPALIFTAHLANWELAAYVAAAYQLDTTVLFRRPNIGAVSDAIIKIRAGSMGTLVPNSLDAPVKLLRVLEAGGHVGILVDQHFGRGVDVTFFGRSCKANPLLAQLARHVECPIHGARIVRLPDRHRFCVELTDEIAPARDADGRIDIKGTMQNATSVVEGWVREHPDQWLWLHRRWR